jgi:hypothetical protein
MPIMLPINHVNTCSLDIKEKKTEEKKTKELQQSCTLEDCHFMKSSREVLASFTCHEGVTGY